MIFLSVFSYHQSSLYAVRKMSGKLVDHKLFDHLEKCGLFSDLQYGFMSSPSTAALLTVASDVMVLEFFHVWAAPQG